MIIMLKLINIRKNDDLIEDDYIPESCNLKAHISLNIESREYNAEEIEEYGAVYSRMAANGLLRTLHELKDTPNKGEAVDSTPRKSATERGVNRLIQRFLNNGKIKTPPKERLVMWY